MRQTRSLLCLLALALILGACGHTPIAEPEPGDGCLPCGPHREPGKISSIGMEELLLLQQTGNLLLIDSRDPWFFRQGRIPGAVNLPTGERMEQQIEALMPRLEEAQRKGHPIIVYCNGFGCHDARTVCKAIARSGLDVTKFGGGWKAWKKFEMPIESASQERADLSPQPAS